MKTEELIESLARDLEPVRRLWHPWLRAAVWVAATGLYLVGLVLMMSPSGLPVMDLADTRFTLEQIASLLFGVTAGVAALSTVVPGYSVRVLLAPIVAGGFWVAMVLVGCAQDVMRYGARIPLETDWPCVAAILIGALPPAAALGLMLRRGAPLMPLPTLALAGLSAAALANVGACLVRIHDTSMTVLLWHGSTLLLLCVAAGALGTSVLQWTSSAAPRSRPT